MNQRELDNIFEKWLWMTPEEKAKHNPFIEMLEKGLRDLPKVKNVDFNN